MKSQHLFALLFFSLSALFAEDGRQAVFLSETGLPYLRNYNHHDFKGNENFTQSQTWSITSDDRGVMYFGNLAGVLTYDGVKWNKITLPNLIARSLATHNGTIYVGGRGTLGYLAEEENGTTVFRSLVADLPESERQFADVWTIFGTPQGVYFQTSEKIFRWSGGEMQTWKSSASYHISFFVRGQYYVRERGTGLLRMENDKLVPAPSGERFSEDRIYAMLPRGDSDILIVTRDSGLYFYDDRDVLRELPSKVSGYLKQHNLYHGARLAGNSFALGTRTGGMLVIDADGQLKYGLTKSHGLQDDDVIFIYPDPQGGAWLALNRGITHIETPLAISVFDIRSGLEGTVLTVERHHGKIFAGTSQNAYMLRDSQAAVEQQISARRFHPLQGIANRCWDLLSTKQGLLFATAGGIYMKSGTAVNRIHSRPAYGFFRSTLDSSRIYLYGYRGVEVLGATARGWRFQRTIAGVRGDVFSMVEDTTGRLWLATQNEGVWCVNGSQILHYDGSHGLPEDELMNIYLLNNTPVFASNQGLFHFDKESSRFMPDTAFAAITDPAPHIVRLWSGGHRQFWLSTDKHELLNVQRRGNGYSLLPNTWLQRMPYTQIYKVFSEDGGVVWIAGYDGLVRYDSTVHRSIDTGYRTLINAVHGRRGEELLSAPRQKVELSGELAYAGNSISIEFTMPAFENESKNRFRYIMNGFDGQWSDWSSDTRKDYTNLPEGGYTFQVQSRNIFGEAGEEADFSFTILPPWYRTPWSYLIYALLFGIALLSIQKFQRSRLIRKERERTRVALLEAENQRKSAELEHAREVQLSMLPSELPDLDHLDIDVYMKTASEVGGDYYDFHLSDEGLLTVAVGDATGHGTNAGMMVAAAKSLFASLVVERGLLQIFNQANRTLNSIRLRGLYMAMIILQIKDYEVEYCAAGMPPLLHFKAREKSIEERLIKAMPWGGVSDFPYRTRKFRAEPGDTLLLMSDGFPERLNRASEMLGYDEAAGIFAEVAHLSAREIIEHFIHAGDEWAREFPQNDDLTFVIIKFRPRT